MSEKPGANNLNITELDFENIKSSLKTFLGNQSEFQDYDFDGSALSVILDLLAYNVHYHGFYANMLANESFLDSALKRRSVVSLAKALGYTPRSVTAARATLTVTINTTDNVNNIEIPKGTKFNTRIDNTDYTFQTLKTYFAEDIGNDQYRAEGVEVVEGRKVVLEESYNGSLENPEFSLKNSNADLTTLKVSVKESISSTASEVYTSIDNVVNVNSDTKVYFVHEGFDDVYRLTFGDDIIGKKPSDGNIIIMEYLATNGEAANKADSFSVDTNISGYTDIDIAVSSEASGGKIREDIESIRRNSPLFYQAQNRAVTKRDYEVLLDSNLSVTEKAESIRVWGGENNDPPIYGKVFISLKPKEGEVVTETLKDQIINEVIRDFNLLTIIPEIKDPEFLYLKPTVNFTYDKDQTTRERDEIVTLIEDKIKEFNDETLEFFEKNFYYSYFVAMIDDVEPSIINNLTELRLEKRISPDYQKKTNLELDYHNAIEVGSFRSSLFKYNEPNAGERDAYFLEDDENGNIRLIKRFSDFTTKVLDADHGTIDYEKGKIEIPQFRPEALVEDSIFRMTCTPKDDNVFSKNNVIITIDRNDITVTGKARE